MGDAADVPQLQEDTAACRMHGVGDGTPAGDLFIVVADAADQRTDSAWA